MKKLLQVLLLIPCSLFFNPLHSQNIYTIAGNGVGGYSGDGGPATAAQIYAAQGVTVDANGNVYIGDELNDRIRIVNSSGIINTFAGNGVVGYSGDGGQATDAELSYANGAAADAIGNVYIVDHGNNCIRMVNPSGIISTFAGNTTGGYSGDGGPATAAEMFDPWSVQTDGVGNVYIADGQNNRIRMVNTSGMISTVAGNGIAGFSGDGGQATAAQLYEPYNLSVDISGNIFIADWYNQRIRKVDPSGIISTIAGNGTGSYSGDGGPATDAELYYPNSAAVDAAGNVYIGDEFNNRVRMVDPSGNINTIAGTGAAGFSGDGGPAAAAQIYTPFTPFADASGNVYFSDANNNRIREISSAALAINKITNGGGTVVYPNPSNGKFTIQESGARNQNSVVEIYNMLGEKVYSQSFSNLNTQYSFNLSSQPAGIYLYRVLDEKGNQVSNGKLVIEK